MEHFIHLFGIILVVILFLVEVFFDQKEHKHLYNREETVHNLLIGVGLIFVAFLGKGILLSALSYLIL
jgi:hypothetical protein